MAINPNTLKALFGKLAPIADDAAKGVVKYGDDVAEDLTRLSAYVSRHNARTPEVPLPVKTALQAPTLNSMGLPINEPSGVLSKLRDALDDLPGNPYIKYKANRTFANAVDNAGWRGNVVSTSGTDRLGPRSLHYADPLSGGPGSSWYEFEDGSVRLPRISKEGLVETSKELRPHKNTALGRWYDNKARDWQSLEMNVPYPTQSDKYGSRSIDGWTPYDEFPQRLGQRTDLIDSADFPDGFTNPDDFARYYDSVELGYSPAEFEDGMWDTINSDDVNSMVLAHNLLKQQELNMPMSPHTFEQAKMLVNKYLEPGYYATKNRSIPNQQYVRQHTLDGTLYDLYDRILNAF